MKQLYILFICILFVFISTNALAFCTTEDRQDYYMNGYNYQQVEGMCNGSNGGGSVVKGNICMTQIGNCPLGQRLPFNSNCYCTVSNGQKIYGSVGGY